MATEAGSIEGVPPELIRAVEALRASPTALTQIAPEDRKVLVDAMNRYDLRAAGLSESTFPATGPFRREKYPAHMEFFASGKWARVRGMIAANRVGKTYTGVKEVELHLTGDYPKWWRGRRFKHPVRVWVCGKTNDKVKDILQPLLLGEYKRARPGSIGSRVTGTGMIPHDLIDQGSIDPR